MQQQSNRLQSNCKKEQENNKNKQKKTLKRKRVSSSRLISRVDLKHIVNINDTWFINQQTLKNPQGSQQNIQRAMFRYKMISKIILNASYVGLQLKKVDDNYLPPEYFFERFRSFGDRQIASIANNLECIYNSFNQLQQLKYFQNSEENNQAIKLLNKFLEQMDGKMYTIYFIQISKRGINLKNIFFSVPLLQALGWNIKRVASDFLKYRHVFFEIFSSKHYKDYIQMCLKNYLLSQELEKDQTLTKEQKIQMTTIYFDDEVIREVESQSGIYQEFLKAKVKFSCPHSSFCCVQILQINQQASQKILKKRKINQGLIEISPQDQIVQLKKLGFQNKFIELVLEKQVKKERSLKQEEQRQ